MRWWLNTDHKTFSVDNAGVRGVDTSALSPDIWMVQWSEGKGEIERQTADGDNENGLREQFYDITPYVPFFKQFLTLMQAKALLLTQAKKIQIDLINQLFESKRQLPFHYPVASGDYWWDATDSSMTSAVVPSLQNTTAKVNEIINKVNEIVVALNSRMPAIIATGDSVIVQSNSNVNMTNAAVAEVIANVNAYVVGYINSYIVNPHNQLYGEVIGHFSNLQGTSQYVITDVTYSGGDPPGVNKSGVTLYYASPGAAGNLSTACGIPVSLGGIGGNSYPLAGISGDFATWGAIPGIGNYVASTNASWIPIGMSTPVPVTPAEAGAIMQGIAARTNELAIVKKTKIAEVNALTNVPAVINYDVLAGWPVIAVPPGYVLEAPIVAASNVTIVGTPIAGGGDGIPEAPMDGVTYGRKSMTWNPALALSGDVLDGGNF